MKKILIATALGLLISTSSFAANKPVVDPATAAANKARIEASIKKSQEKKAAKAAFCAANPKDKKCKKLAKKKK